MATRYLFVPGSSHDGRLPYPTFLLCLLWVVLIRKTISFIERNVFVLVVTRNRICEIGYFRGHTGSKRPDKEDEVV